MDHENAPEWAKEQMTRKPTGLGSPNRYPWSTTPVGGTFDIPPGPHQPTLVTMKKRCYKKLRAGAGDFICHQYPDGLIQVYRRG